MALRFRQKSVLLTVVALVAVIASVVAIALLAWQMAASPSAAEGGEQKNEAGAGTKNAAFTVVILGDSTGNDVGEWPDLWADDLAVDRGVILHLFDRETNQYFPPAQKGDGTPPIDLWVGAIPGATGAVLTQEWDRVWPRGKPDLVLISLGQNGSSTIFADQTSPLLARVRESAPSAAVMVILQAPRANDANAPAREVVREWAVSQQLPTIDVAAVFNASQTPLNDLLKEDGIHPNDAGSRLWAQVVENALGPL